MGTIELIISFNNYEQSRSQQCRINIHKSFFSELALWVSLFLFIPAVNAIFVQGTTEFDKAAFRFFNNLASDRFKAWRGLLSFSAPLYFLLRHL